MPIDFNIFILCIIFIVSGACAGLIAGLLGVGGGIILVPVLFHGFDFMGVPDNIRMYCAVGTSLAVIMITGLRSAYLHYMQGTVDLMLLRRWTPFLIFGVILGSVTVGFINTRILILIFGCVSFGISIYLMLKNSFSYSIDFSPRLSLQYVMASLIGFISSLMGIGGGIFSVTLLVLSGYSIHKAIGTSAAFGFFIAVTGTIGFIFAGKFEHSLPLYSIGYVNVLAVILLIPLIWVTVAWGTRISHRFSRRKLEYVFSVFLMGTAIRMFWVLWS